MLDCPIVLILPWAYDYIAEGLVKGLTDLGVEYRADQLSNGVNSVTENSELINLMNSGALVVVCTGLGLNTSLIDSIPSLERVILVDGTDYSDFESLKSLQIDLSLVKGIFKREFLASWLKNPPLDRLYPFPMCSTAPLPCATAPKRYLMSFLGNTRTNPLRGVYMDWLRVKFELGENVRLGSTGECSYDSMRPRQHRIETPHYDEILACSLSSLNLPGAGFDCKRYWEIPGGQALILAHHSPLYVPNDFSLGKEKLEFGDAMELEAIFRKLKGSPQYALDIINSASEKLEQYHTARMRVSYFLENIL